MRGTYQEILSQAEIAYFCVSYVQCFSNESLVYMVTGLATEDRRIDFGFNY